MSQEYPDVLLATLSRRAVLQGGALAAAGVFLDGPAALAQAAEPRLPLPAASSLLTSCELLEQPLGLQIPRPRLSWMPAGVSQSAQAAFQVMVSSHPGGPPDLWNSGRVASSEPAIEYGGKPIQPYGQAFWRVRTWDAAGRVSVWSHEARWSAGPRSEADWGDSVWIGRDDLLESTQELMPGSPGTVPEPNFFPAPYLRRRFETRGPVRSALLHACGLGFAELYVNGVRLGDAERDPGFTNFDRSALYVTHDVTPLIQRGPNALGAILGTGWYDTHDVATWHMNTAPWRQRPRLRLLLVLDFADGSRAFIDSDASWKAAAGPILRDGIYTGEVYDARREMPGWSTVDFNDAAWQPVLLVEAPRGTLKPLTCPPVRIAETITPVAITEPTAGVFIVNIGQNIAGHVQLRVRGPAGHAITMRYAELLNPDGTLNSKPIDHFMETTVPRQPFQQDTYICKGTGEIEVWEQRFSWSGFQYVEVTNFPGRPTLDNFRARFAHTDTPSAGDFACSDETANLVQSATRRSFLSNAQSYPTDCPQREKNGWTGDAGLAVEAGLMNFQSATFYTKWLEDFAEAQRPDGGVPVIVPNGGWGNGERWPGDVCPPWDAAYPIITWEVYRATGDRRVLASHIKPLRRYVDFFLSHRGTDGLAPALGIGDWSPFKTVTPQDYITNAYLFLDLTLLTKIFVALGQTSEAQHYGALAEDMRVKTHARFYSNETHRYSNGSQMGQGMALYFGITPAAERPYVLADLVKQIETLGHLDVGYLGAKFVTRALAEGGHADLAYRVCMQPTMPSYGYWVKTMRSTTLWEGWKAGPSYNHIMFGDISAWMFHWIAGLQQAPGSAGYKQIVFQPTPVAGLTSARAKYLTPRGEVASSWTVDSKKMSLEITVPGGSTARLMLPPGSQMARPTAPTEQLGVGVHRFDVLLA